MSQLARTAVLLALCLAACFFAASRVEPGPPVAPSAPPPEQDTPFQPTAPDPCGNDICRFPNTCATCPEDCGSCCGNGACDNGETCSTCPGDCGGCANSCFGRCGNQAPAGCWCDAGCAERGDCCADATSLCTIVPIVSSCQRNRCGKTWKITRPHMECTLGSGLTDCGYPYTCPTVWAIDGTGCSCEPGCGYLGTCCTDAGQYCDATDGEVDPGADTGVLLMDGEQFFRWTPPASIASMNGRGTEIAYLSADGTTAGSKSAAGLTRVSFHEMVGHTEDSRCSIERSTVGNSPYWNVTAFTVKRDDFGNKGELDAGCSGMGVRWPVTLTGGNVPTLSGDIPSIAWDDSQLWEAWLGPDTSTIFPFLTYVGMADLKDGTEAGSCLIHLGTHDSNGVPRNGWYLQASSHNDARAWCEARVLDLRTSGAVKAPCPASDPETWFSRHGGNEYGDCVDSGRFRAHARGEAGGPTIYTSTVKLLPAYNHACFLTQVYFEDLDDPEENTTCEITKSRSYWWLTATATQDMDAHCNAMCVKFPAAQTLPAPAIELTAGLGERLTLFQQGAYDKPVVFLEGLDVTNDGDSAGFQRDYGLFLRRGATQGVDVWHVSYSDGGQPVLESARETAESIDNAYKYSGWNGSHPGKGIAVVGASMGALAGRVALASWEEGEYHCSPGTGECISPGLGDGTTDPPVAVFGSVGGPHQGATIPVTLQTMVQDLGNQWSLGKPARMLNSPAATNMLYARVDDRCGDPVGVVTEVCTVAGFPTKNTLRNGNLVLDHVGECEGFVNADCVNWHSTAPFTWTCLEPATSHDNFYGEVNTRNGDGFPHGVATLGLSNGTFQWPAYGLGADIGLLDFEDLGGPSCGAFCERDTTVRPIFVEPRPSYRTNLERLPGDRFPLTEHVNAVEGAIATPKHVKKIDLTAYVDFTFVPTESALACPGVTPGVDCTAGVNCDAVCAARSPFDKVASSPAAQSGSHSTLDGLRLTQLQAFLYDAFVDGDGLCSPANPFAYLGPTYVGCVGPDDCNDTLPEGAPCDGPDGDLCKEGTLHCGASPQCSDTTGTNVELCNGVDDDCDGVVDDACTTCGDGVCNGNDDCTNCPGDCDLETITVSNHSCLMCDSTGDIVCGPGTFLWCCPN